jgi:hypothetical protein
MVKAMGASYWTSMEAAGMENEGRSLGLKVEDIGPPRATIAAQVIVT